MSIDKVIIKIADSLTVKEIVELTIALNEGVRTKSKKCNDVFDKYIKEELKKLLGEEVKISINLKCFGIAEIVGVLESGKVEGSGKECFHVTDEKSRAMFVVEDVIASNEEYSTFHL